MNKIETFQEKVSRAPENMFFRFSLGQALYDAGQFDAAIGHLSLCAESREDWMLPRILLGKALLERGAPEEAETVLKDALKLAVAQHHEDPEAELRELLHTLET